MKLPKKSLLGPILMGIALISVGLLPEEATSIVFLGIIILLGLREPRLGLMRSPVILLILLLVNGLLMAWRHPLGDVIKDIWYFSLPLITLMVGWFCAGKTDQRLTFKIIYLASGAYSIYFILATIYYVTSGEISLNDQYSLRQLLGAGEIISAWGCLMAFARPLGDGVLVGRFRGLIVPILIVNLLAILISGSRTSLFLMMVGFFLAILPGLILKRYKRTYWITLAGMVVAIVIFGLVIAPQFADSRTAMGRLANTFREVFNFKFQDLVDINQKWRAYESLMAINTFIGGGPAEYIFGQGFGAKVDLQMLQGLGVGSNIIEFQYIPVLHNGYLMVLVKAGLMGLILYLAFLYKLLQHCNEVDSKRGRKLWRLLSKGILFGTVFATLVIAGPFAKGVFFTSFIILGASLRYSSELNIKFNV